LAWCVGAGCGGAWIVQNEGIAKAALLDADATALLCICWLIRAGVVHQLLMMLGHRVVLQLLELVAGGHVSELFPTVVVQDGTRGLLVVVAWSAAYDHSVGRRHGHWADTDWYDMRRPSCDPDSMVRRHCWNYHILHDLAEL